jgi:hypothetical protein
MEVSGLYVMALIQPYIFKEVRIQSEAQLNGLRQTGLDTERNYQREENIVQWI